MDGRHEEEGSASCQEEYTTSTFEDTKEKMMEEDTWFPPPTTKNILIQWERHHRKWCAVVRDVNTDRGIQSYWIYVDDSDGRGWREWNIEFESNFAAAIRAREEAQTRLLKRVLINYTPEHINVTSDGALGTDIFMACDTRWDSPDGTLDGWKGR